MATVVTDQHAAYQRYLMCMCDHDCQCLALTFEVWAALEVRD